MGREIERKFLLRHDGWRKEVSKSTPYRQGYLVGGERCSVRVRKAGERAFLNIKSGTLSIGRDEYEYEIPMTDAEEILARLCAGPQIEKTRHLVPAGPHVWEIDEFDGDNAGLIVAEIELSDADEAFERPDWLGEEVSLDARYYNVNLVRHPYRTWKDGKR